MEACLEILAVNDSLDQCGVGKMFKIRLDLGCVLKESASRRGAQCRDRSKEMKDSIQVLKCSPVEMTLFLGSGEMWSGADWEI